MFVAIPTEAWTREEVYELVWSQQMTKLATVFGVSKVAIGKNCRKLRIPLPGRGYFTFAHIQQREGRWVIVGLVCRHGRVRTVPMPTWTKNAIDARAAAADIADGHVFRRVNRGDVVSGERLNERVIWQFLRRHAIAADLPATAPHDLRRTTAKLCRAAGGELEQIQLLLGHSYVQTTERCLGMRQELVDAPNDGIKLRL